MSNLAQYDVCKNNDVYFMSLFFSFRIPMLLHNVVPAADLSENEQYIAVQHNTQQCRPMLDGKKAIS